VPSRAMMLRTEADVRAQADELAKQLNALDGITATVAADHSQPGSGSAPGVFLPTFAIRVVHAKLKVDRLSALLRRGTPSVFCRIHDGAALLDPRTLLPGDGERLLQAFEALS